MGEVPADPFTTLGEGAVQMHEQYTAFVDAGFSVEQAFAIVLTTLSLAVTHQLQKGDDATGD